MFENCVEKINYTSPWTQEELVLDCHYDHYVHGGIALELLHTDEDGWVEPYATASVCVNGLDEFEIAIKDYSENEGMLQQLLDNGVIYPPHRYVRSGFVVIPVCHLKAKEDEK